MFDNFDYPRLADLSGLSLDELIANLTRLREMRRLKAEVQALAPGRAAAVRASFGDDAPALEALQAAFLRS